MHPQPIKRTPAAWFTLVVGLALVASNLFVGSVYAASPSANVLANNTPGFVKQAKDLGPVDPTTVITVTAWLNLPNQNKLDQLVQQQYQKGSSSFHQWLNQTQFNSSYAPSAQQVNAVQNFLSAHNLTVLAVAENNFYVKVQGTVAAVEKAFHVQIDNYNYKGAAYRSNNGNPSINDPSGGLVAGITGMDDFGFQPTFVKPSGPDGTPFPMTPISSSPNGVFFEGQCFRGVETHTFSNSAPSTTASYTGNRYGADICNSNLGHLAPCGYSPSELYTAYNLNGLYAAGLDGSGQTVVITDAFGSPTIQQDAEVFSQVYGLPDLTPANFQIYRAPGAVNNPHDGTWADETTLDVEWVHAIAPKANIALVIGPTNHSDLDEAINYAVVHHLGNTISNSWSTVEGVANPVVFDRDNRILEMAAAEGIDVNFATGDFGDEEARIGFKTVDFPASSPFANGIGGTTLALNANNSINFQTGWGNNLTRIAETSALNNVPVNPPLPLGFQGGAGGGTSLFYSKPAFQSSLTGSMRMVPDISFLADAFTGVEIVETVGGVLSVGVIGGTSLATPMFSGLMAIAAQKAGHGLGQAAQLVYNLPAGAVTDVTSVSSPNNVSGSITTPSGTTNYSADQLAAPLGTSSPFYSALYNSPFSTRWFVITFGTDTSLAAGPGWDDVTGVGTPNGMNFINAVTQ